VSSGQLYTATLGFLACFIKPSASLVINKPFNTKESFKLPPKSLATLMYSISKFNGFYGKALMQASAINLLNYSACLFLFNINN